MKERIILLFNFASHEWPRAQSLFRSIGRHDLAAEPERFAGYPLEFDSDLDVRRFWDQAEAHGFEHNTGFVRRERIYSDKELVSFPLLTVEVNRAPHGLGGPTYGTEYDLSSACPACGTGATQVSALYLRRSDLPRSGKVGQTLDHEILVGEEFRSSLERRSITGLELRQVREAGSGLEIPWFQVLANHELPPMHASTAGMTRDNPCPKCGRDGHFHMASEPLEIVYDLTESELGSLPDVSHTWEHFGNSVLRNRFEKSHFAYGLLVVRPSVLGLVREGKARGISFLPIRLTSSPA